MLGPSLLDLIWADRSEISSVSVLIFDDFRVGLVTLVDIIV